MVSIETGSNAGTPRHGSIFVNARIRKRACVKGLTLRLVSKQAANVQAHLFSDKRAAVSEMPGISA